MQDLSVMMSASLSCRTSCARSLYVDLLCKISLSGSLHQDPVGPLVKISVCGSLVQDLSVMMSASGSCRTSCTRSLYEDLLCKVSVSRSPQLDYLCRISVCGSLVQDLSGMMSASGSSRISCARSLHGDLLYKISLSGCLHQDSVGPLAQDLCMKSEIATLPAFRAMDTHDLRRGLHFEIRNRNFTRIPHSAHLTRTISAEGCGCTSKSETAISPAFRALDTHDLRRGLHFEIKKCNFTCIPSTRHARSPQRVHISKPCFRSTTPATKS